MEILKISSLDCFYLINELSSAEELKEILVDFLKTTAVVIMENEAWDEAKIKLVYGAFAKNPSSFAFLPGQKLMIKKIFKESLKHKSLKEFPIAGSSKGKRLSTPAKNCESLEDHLKSTLTNFWIAIKEKESYDGPEKDFEVSVKEHEGNYVASLNCLVCCTKIEIKKNGSSPWITSNYYTHLKKHVQASQTKIDKVHVPEKDLRNFFPVKTLSQKKISTSM